MPAALDALVQYVEGNKVRARREIKPPIDCDLFMHRNLISRDAVADYE